MQTLLLVMNAPGWVTHLQEQWNRKRLGPPAESSASTGSHSEFRWPWAGNWAEGVRWPWDRSKSSPPSSSSSGLAEERRKRLHKLSRALRAENLADLEDVVAALLLSECAYKSDDDLFEKINNFKADFGGDLMKVRRFQQSLPHVTHRYLIAEGDKTLYASFIGSKKIRDFLADANVLQESLFPEAEEEEAASSMEPFQTRNSASSVMTAGINGLDLISNSDPTIHSDHSHHANYSNGRKAPTKRSKRIYSARPMVHRGFLNRARNIPVMDIYHIAKRKKLKIVFCGHSLGGAVAVLSTLSLLKNLSDLPPSHGGTNSKESDNFSPEIKCITFSQPPVGNEALKDLVHENGWQNVFRSYCIPEDIIPRLLSPDYFNQYHMQMDFSQTEQFDPNFKFPENDKKNSAKTKAGSLLPSDKQGNFLFYSKKEAASEKNDEFMKRVKNLLFLDRASWRIPKLAPLVTLSNPFLSTNSNRIEMIDHGVTSVVQEKTNLGSRINFMWNDHKSQNQYGIYPSNAIPDEKVDLEYLHQQNNHQPSLKSHYHTTMNDCIDLRSNKIGCEGTTGSLSDDDKKEKNGNSVCINELVKEKKESENIWTRPLTVFPSYVPFGKVYLLGTTSVEPVTATEFSHFLTFKGFFSQLRQRFKAHTMKSYRARFHNIVNVTLHEGMDFQSAVVEQLSHLNDWISDSIYPYHLANPMIIRTATSILPIGWNGIPSESKTYQLKIDIQGHRLHLCSLVRVKINGTWYSAEIESSSNSSVPSSFDSHNAIQSMRIRVKGPQNRIPVIPRVNPANSVKNIFRDSNLPIISHPTPSPDGVSGISSMDLSLSSLSGAPKNTISKNSGELPLAEFRDTMRQFLKFYRSMKSVFGERMRFGLWFSNGNVTRECLSEWDRCSFANYGSWSAENIRVECSSDFEVVEFDVMVKVRRVRMIGLEGAGKTCLYHSLLGDESFTRNLRATESFFPEKEWQIGVKDGVAYLDTAGIDIRNVERESSRLRKELSSGTHGINYDILLLVHNTAHKIPHIPIEQNPNPYQSKIKFASLGKKNPNLVSSPGDETSLHLQRSYPALSPLLREASLADVPVVLAVTNKYAISSEVRQEALRASTRAYGIQSENAVLVNSRPFSIYSTDPEPEVSGRLTPGEEKSFEPTEKEGGEKEVKDKKDGRSRIGSLAMKAIGLPFGFVRKIPFRNRKVDERGVEGVDELRDIIHKVLLDNEEQARRVIAMSALEKEFLREKEEMSWNQKIIRIQSPRLAAAALSMMGLATALFLSVIRNG